MPTGTKITASQLIFGFTSPRLVKKCWNAEVLVIDPPPYSASRKINLRRVFDSRDQADNHARAFIEKWIDDGKPSIDPGELD